MLIGLAVPPDVLDAEMLSDSEYHIGLQIVFEELGRGEFILVTDREKVWIKELVQKVQELPSKYRKPYEILLFNFLHSSGITKESLEGPARRKNKDLDLRLIGACELEHDSDRSLNECVNLLTHRGLLDVVVAPFGASIQSEDHIHVTDPINFRIYNRDRQRFVEGMELSDLTIGQFKELLSRSIRFTRWLRFYDKFPRESNTKRYFNCLDFILETWTTTGYFPQKSSGSQVEIFAAVEPVNRNHFDEQIEDTIERNRRTVQVVQQELIEKLNQKYNKLSIKVEWKGTTRDILRKRWHDRYLETENLVLQFGRGFDFLTEDNTLDQCTFSRVVLKNRGLLNEIRKLPQFSYR